MGKKQSMAFGIVIMLMILSLPLAGNASAEKTGMPEPFFGSSLQPSPFPAADLLSAPNPATTCLQPFAPPQALFSRLASASPPDTTLSPLPVPSPAPDVVGRHEEMSAPLFQQTPFISAGMTFVPAREMADLMGFYVHWDPQKEQVVLAGESSYGYIRFAAVPRGEGELLVHLLTTGEEEAAEAVAGDLPAELEEPRSWEYRKLNGHIFLPLRPLAEMFCWRIDWDEQDWTVSIWTAGKKGASERLAISFPVELWFDPEEDSGEPPGKVAYLTFDDGPSAKVTPRILDILMAEGVPATFFVTGAHAEKHPGIIRRIQAEGHTLGNHTYSHRAEVIYASPEAFMREVRKTEEIIYEITGERTRILRAPYGSYPNLTAPFRRALAEAGYKYVDWNVDSMDSRRSTVPVELIVHAVKRQVPGKDRVFILFHDLPSKTTTAQALPEIISYLREQQYIFRPLSYDVDMFTHW